MKFVGITAEYNPMHNGHIYHIAQSLKLCGGADAVIVVLSGDFTQSGEPALCNKYKRAAVAVENGADIVLELPVHYATGCAERFAKGAVKILSSIHGDCVLSFGSECGDIELLSQAARLMNAEESELKAIIADLLDKGKPYPSVRANAVVEYAAKHGITLPDLTSPNNILGIEYLRAALNYRNVSAVTVKRVGNYKDGKDGFLSATALRNLPKSDLPRFRTAVPIQSYRLLAEENTPNFSDVLLYRLKTADVAALAELEDVSEGLENRIKREAADAYSYTELLNAISTKRYTTSRLKRILLYSALYITEKAYSEADAAPVYYNVLAVKKERRDLLSLLAESGEVVTGDNVLARIDNTGINLRATALYGTIKGSYPIKNTVIV